MLQLYLVLSFFINLLLQKVSNELPRARIRVLIPIHVVLVCFDTINQIVGLDLLFGYSPLICPHSSISIVLTHISVILGTITLILWFLLLSIHYVSSLPLSLSSFESNQLWRSRLEFLCFGHRKGDDDLHSSQERNHGDILHDISRVFNDFFSDIDFVASDILVGLISVRKRQKILKKRRTLGKTLQLSASSSSESLKVAVTIQELRDVEHFFQYAEAIYGIYFYL